MRWQNRRESSNVEDRRSQSSSRMSRIGLPQGKGGILMLLVVLVAGYYGVDLSMLLGGGGNSGMFSPASYRQSTPPNNAKDDELAKFTSVVLASTEDIWKTIFTTSGKKYTDPKLVLFRDATSTSCGRGDAAMGPFYCPLDKTVYIDLSFYQDMRERFGADGDFAHAYVIAHEVGHHVQNLLGTADQVRAVQQKSRNQVEVNQLSVRLELQADCYAGVWGNYMGKQQALDEGDLDEALNAAEAIGDDRLQKQGQGQVVPDSFTHGSSKQRHEWFKRGFDSGDPSQCDTFSVNIAAK